MTSTYRVTAPYILLQVTDQAGKGQVNGFYEGGIVTNPVDDARLRKAVDRGWVERVATPSPTPAAPATPAAAPIGGDDQNQVPTGSADEVLVWVGDNADRAKVALAAERGSAKPRTTLVDKLDKLTGQD
jgi:hypothetical protein